MFFCFGSADCPARRGGTPLRGPDLGRAAPVRGRRIWRPKRFGSEGACRDDHPGTCPTPAPCLPRADGRAKPATGKGCRAASCPCLCSGEYDSPVQGTVFSCPGRIPRFFRPVPFSETIFPLEYEESPREMCNFGRPKVGRPQSGAPCREAAGGEKTD